MNGGIVMNRFVAWLVTSDTQMFHFINHSLRCPAFDYLLPKITHVGGATFTLTSLFLLISFGGTTIQTWAFHGLLSLTLSHIIVHFIKMFYCRERPYINLTNVNLCDNPLKDYSFPSGHTTAAFSIAVVFALHSALLAILLLPIAFLIGLSRMYLGLHYPTDCIIGALLGTISSFIIVFIASNI